MTKPTWWNVLAALGRFVKTEGWWPTARELSEYVDAGMGRWGMTKQLRKLRDDPVPLVSYERKGWQVTIEGWRILEREPVVARYAFRPRVLPGRMKRRRNAVVRATAVEVFEGRGGEMPIVE